MKLELRLLSTWRWVCIAAMAFVFAATFSRVLASVTLEKLEAKAETNRIRILWATASELQNAGFYVLRSTAEAGPYASITKVNSSGQTQGTTYQYYDTAVTPGIKYYYRLASIDTSNKTETTTPVSAIIAAPTTTKTSTSAPTATRTPTGAPTATATRTHTSAPNATATQTSTTAPTPTRTNTLVPGAPTFTPVPTFTASPIPTAAQKIAQVAPSPTTARTGGAIILPTATPAPATNPTRIALAPAPVAPTDPPIEDAPLEEEDLAAEQSTRFNFAPLIAIGIIFATGATSVTGFALAIFALYFFIRSKRSV